MFCSCRWDPAFFSSVMHQSPVRAPPRGGFAPTDANYTNGKSKPSSDGRMTAIVLVFAFVVLCFGGLVWQVSALASSTSEANRRITERAGADDVFWGDMVGRGKPFADVIPRSQFTVEKGHALEYTSTYNIKECGDKCVANELCVAFSFVKPHKKDDRLHNSRPNRCILVSGHYTSTKFEDATIVRRDPAVVARLRKEREDVAAAGGANPVFKTSM